MRQVSYLFVLAGLRIQSENVYIECIKARTSEEREKIRWTHLVG